MQKWLIISKFSRSSKWHEPDFDDSDPQDDISAKNLPRKPKLCCGLIHPIYPLGSRGHDFFDLRKNTKKMKLSIVSLLLLLSLVSITQADHLFDDWPWPVARWLAASIKIGDKMKGKTIDQFQPGNSRVEPAG